MSNKIPLYETGKLSIDPSATGEAAFQQAGRRIGPAYNEAATLTRSIAEAQAATIRQRKWPFDMLALERSLEVSGGKLGGTAAAATGGGEGIKLQGGVNNLVDFNDKLTDGTKADKGTKQRGHSNAIGADIGAQGLSAATLGHIAAGMAARSGGYHNSVIDPLSGRDLNSRTGGGAEGVSVIDPRTGMDITKLPKSKYDTVLDKGVIKKIDRETGKEVGGPTSMFGNGPNADADKAANAFGHDEANGSFDPRTEQGAKNIAKFKADNGYDPNSGKFAGSPLYTGPQDDPQKEARSAQPDQYMSGGDNEGPRRLPPSVDPWWQPSVSDLKQQLSPGGDSEIVNEGREDRGIYGRPVGPETEDPQGPYSSRGGSGSSSNGDFGDSDPGGGGDEE